MFDRVDPGPCPICGHQHSACTADSGPIVVVQLPARDAAARAAPDPLLGPSAAPALVGDAGGSAPREFATGTYRGDGKRKRL